MKIKKRTPVFKPGFFDGETRLLRVRSQGRQRQIPDNNTREGQPFFNVRLNLTYNNFFRRVNGSNYFPLPAHPTFDRHDSINGDFQPQPNNRFVYPGFC